MKLPDEPLNKRLAEFAREVEDRVNIVVRMTGVRVKVKPPVEANSDGSFSLRLAMIRDGEKLKEYSAVEEFRCTADTMFESLMADVVAVDMAAVVVDDLVEMGILVRSDEKSE